MHRTLGVVAATMLALASHQSPHAAPAARSVELPDGFAYPNGIAFDGHGGLVVGSVVSGDIVAIELGERPRVRFTEEDNRFAGTALRIDQKRAKLWVASPDFLGVEVNGETVRRPHRVAVLDAASGEIKWSAPMPESGFANDIALDGEGGAFITDSSLGRVVHVAEPGAPFVTIADGLESRNGPLGPAGIAVASDGSLIVGLYSDGRLVRITPGADGRQAVVEDIDIAAPISNPDGMTFGPDGHLLVVDGGVATGNGRLVSVDLGSASPHPVRTILSGLELPVNLSVEGRQVAVTESRIRHRMVDDPALLVPERFRVILLTLDRPARQDP